MKKVEDMLLVFPMPRMQVEFNFGSQLSSCGMVKSLSPKDNIFLEKEPLS